MRNKIRSDIIDLTGKKFGRLTVLKKGEKTRTGSKWICKCDCGNIKSYWSVNLRNGPNKSCGCFRNSTQDEYLKDLEKRLLLKSEIIGDCREWKAKHTVKFGYGMISIKSKPIAAHRAAWMVWKGEIPKGMWVLHKCDNPKCINPDHLFLGTPKDNIYDMINKKRNRHLKGENVQISKLKENDILEIREFKKLNKYSINELCEKYNVSRFCIHCIIYRKTWRHIP